MQIELINPATLKEYNNYLQGNIPAPKDGQIYYDIVFEKHGILGSGGAVLHHFGGGVKMISGPPSELDRSHITEFHITPILGKYERNSCNILDAVHIKLKWSSGEIHKEGILSDLIENVSVEY